MLQAIQVSLPRVLAADLPLCCIAVGPVEHAWPGDDVANGAGVVSSSSSWRWRASKEETRAVAARATRTRGGDEETRREGVDHKRERR